MAPEDSNHLDPGDAGAAGGAAPADNPGMVEQLRDTDTGRWQVTTRTSIYLVDLDRRTVVRIPGAGGEHGIDPDRGLVYYVATLDGGRRSLPLVRLHTCVVGREMALFTSEAGQPRLRTSTQVREIRRLPTATRRSP